MNGKWVLAVWFLMRLIGGEVVYPSPGSLRPCGAGAEIKAPAAQGGREPIIYQLLFTARSNKCVLRSKWAWAITQASRLR